MSVESEEWFQKYNQLVKRTLEAINSQDRSSTPADTGLVLVALEDYIERGNTDRVLRLLELADNIIEAKHNIPDVSWFDVYESLMISFSGSHDGYEDDESPDSDIEDVFSTFDESKSTSSHDREFKSKIKNLTEVIRSDEADELQNSDPYPDLEDANINHFAHAISSEQGFQFGQVEIPNNASRMKLSQTLIDASEGLTDADYNWVMTRLKDWVSHYARAEATVANRNLEHKELREFMLESQTPAEKYWK